MSEDNENPVPLGPSELCFDSSCFVKESFTVDKFLKDHRNKANLETMRDDLGIYLKFLRSALIDLINKDYADFVNLSSNLIGLDKAIKRIQTPMGQLREELLQVRASLDGAMCEVSNQMFFRRDIREKKRSLRSLSRVHSSLKKIKFTLLNESSDSIYLERAAAEYCQLHFYMQKCSKDLNSFDVQDFESVGELVDSRVDKLFLDAVNLGTKQSSSLKQSLIFYQSLDKVSNAERLYKCKVVSPIMDKLITENTLKSLPRGLPALYDKIIEFLDSDMKILLEISSEINMLSVDNKFRFFLKSFWPEIEQRLEVNLPSVYAAGDPDIFFKRYTETQVFLEAVFKRCDPETVNELYTHPSYLSFIDKWSLPVYFQLRFQEIALSVESGLSLDNLEIKTGEWKISCTEITWKCLNRCWDNGVYLTPIAHKFWKLSLQIISRYITWIKEISKQVNKAAKLDIHFLVHLHTDVVMLIQKLPEFYSKATEKLPKLSQPTANLLLNSLNESENALKCQLEDVGAIIVQVLSNDNVSLLRQVNDIPRLFRRTNREPPTRSCQYVSSLLDGPSQFYSAHKSNPNTIKWLCAMFSIVTKQYYASVDDVLNSVKKTEESLRRLKKARDRSNNVIPPSDRRVGDDNKIRHQLLLDIHAYVKGIEEFNLNRNSIDQLNDLLLLVEASQKQ